MHGGRNILIEVHIEHATAPERVYAASGECPIVHSIEYR